jgi:hypothetical protein
MRKRIGRPWREVEGDIRATFDTRSLAGQHIVFDHMLPTYHPPQAGWRVGRTSFVVDDEGILREQPRRPYAPYRWYGGSPPPLPEWVVRWLHGRKVGLRGARAYWLEPTGRERPSGEPAYRQARALTDADLTLLHRLETHVRARVVVDLSD